MKKHLLDFVVIGVIVLFIYAISGPIYKAAHSGKEGRFRENVSTVIVDGCEYLIFQDPQSYDKFSVTHKGNCSSSFHKSHP